MASCGTFQKLSPLSLLDHLSSCYDSTHLKVSSGSVSWSIYLEEGKITYASHSIAPFDRLDCHLHRLSHKIPSLTSETRAQLSLIFETDTKNQLISNPEYQAIGWLVNHQYLNQTQAVELIEGLVSEVVESFLLVKAGTYEFKDKLEPGQIFCLLDCNPIVEVCQKRLQGWKSFAPQIWSPYQRLYFSNRHKLEQLSPEIQHKLGAILKGFSFRHLAVLLNQDELQLAQSLYHYIVAGTISLQDPYPPFDQLPKTFEQPIYERSSNTIDETPSQINKVRTNRIVIPPMRTINPNQSLQFSLRKPDLQPPEKKDLVEKPRHQSTTNSNNNTAAPKNPPIVTTTSNKNVQQPVNPPVENVASNNTVEQPVNPPTLPIPLPKKVYKVVCVDDSQAMLQELTRCLEDDIFSVFTISSPVKALMQIIKIKPDLILLDVNMAGIDGYELCRLLRNHSLFKTTPIIMVTGNTGIFNRVKARIVGASGYLTKPFTQPDLLKLMFKYLS